MRVLVAIWIGLLVLVGTAHAAPNYELNRIRGNIDSAESRLKDNLLPNARTFVDMAKGDLANASAETKRDPEYPRLQQRLARIEADLGRREAAAGKSSEADDKLREAESTWRFAEISIGSDDYEKARAGYEKCLALIAEGKAIDASVMSRGAGNSSTTGTDLEKKCREGTKKQLSVTPANDTEEGKAAAAAYALAVKASEAKKLTAEVLVAGLQGMDECRNQVGRLTSIYLRNNTPKYDKEKQTIETVKGSVSLAELDKRCAKYQLELKQKQATGCGKATVVVAQDLLPGPRWSALRTSNVESYEMVKCSEMPKANKFPGKSASFKAQFTKQCGAGAIYTIYDSNWNDHGSTRNFGGACWKKGQLRFYK